MATKSNNKTTSRTRKNITAAAGPARKTPAKAGWRQRLRARLPLAAAGAVLLIAVAGVLLLSPDSSPVSLASLSGRNSDRTAPKLDTLKGNYSVAGEAASTSLLVKYKDSVQETTKAAVHKQVGAKVQRKIGPLGVDVVHVSSTDSVGETIRKYKAHGEVEYAEPNYLAKRFVTPDDTLFSKQWGLQKVHAPEAWDISQGGFGPIAVIDTGIMANQSDLAGEVLTGYNYVNDTTDTADDNGHGTHVAGIISASTNNASGVSSIGYEGSLLPVKVLDGSGQGTYGDVASGIIYATDRGAKILNLSLGGSSASRTLQDAINYALSHGAVVVAAAGNNGNDAAVYPAAYPGVVAVSASDQNDNLAGFSSYGSHTYVSAPGVGIISTYNSGGYATMSGTSMAAPLVSGLVGLALSKGATTPADILDSLKTTSDKVGPYAYDQNGWNQYFGYGRVNAAKLLSSAAQAPAPSPASETDDADKPASKPGRGNSQRSARNDAGQRNGPQFDTVIEGSIDSIDMSRSVIVVKVKSSSNNLPLRSGSLIDLEILSTTAIKSGRDNIQLDALAAGDKLNIKAQWKDNRLNGQEIKLVGHSAARGGGR